MSGKFEPKQKVELDPPKDDPISLDYLSKCDVFAGKDASRALAQSSLKKEECRPEWEDLKPEHKKVLDDWYTFFSKRYNIKGKVATDSANL
ncbi:hypothetical protein E4T38_03753 [Aureobasidium subglaciale]|nr:hypothetical protein E4T38_03753 [Aureobasidium subglaciale]KAI5225017.1 hypothetical protein E4T41_05501 [Aureobasidium subglaciale]KAI5225355.1 hypothetical protein E4T40_03528 [Aureobasidium subglaciale]KAI5244478.1 hypothetical protein E4T43_03809 [Aureobasidium subglaciale]KAI5261212.1 hypothetical protein E4T46_05394 [Aureobasidium subglaciale]